MVSRECSLGLQRALLVLQRAFREAPKGETDVFGKSIVRLSLAIGAPGAGRGQVAGL